MRKRISLIICIIMLICIIFLGTFSLPIGITLCSVIGVIYGIKHKDKSFLKCSSVLLVFGTLLIIYTLLNINSM